MRQKRFLTVCARNLRRAAWLALGCVAGSGATTYTISNNTMALTNDGTCGFREALDAINSGTAKWGCSAPSGTNTINLSALTYTTPVPLYVMRSVSIRCPSGTCTIDAGTINGNLFTITEIFTPDVTMYRLTLRQPAANTNSISGVALYSGTATLDQTVITGFRNAGFFGTNSWPLKLLGCTFSGNNTGISLDNSGEATLTSNTISNNGLGLYLVNWSNAQSQSNAITGNGTGVQLGYGAIFNDQRSSITNSTGTGLYVTGGSFYLNSAIVSGNKNRGIYMGYSTTGYAYYTTIDGNSTSGDGAGLALLSDGTGGTAFGEFYQCTFSNNKAGGNGGGIYVSGTSNVINSTISSNTAARGAGAYDYVASTNSYLNIIQSTVAFNQASVSGGGVVNVRGNGVDDLGLNQTIVAKNSAPTHPDVSGLNKGKESLFGNLTGSQGDHSDDFPAADPLLGPLMDSPGRLKLKTHALLKGSPALNKIAFQTQYNYDGRGFPRRATENWDVGAYEEGPFETESLTVVSSLGSNGNQEDNQFSNGAGTVMYSGAVGNYVTYMVAVPEGVAAGTAYNIQVRARKSPDGAKFELATAPGTTQFTAIGEVDLYRATAKDTTFNLSFNFTQPGIKHFRLRMTGRNAANTFGYFGFFDYFKIAKK